MTLGGRRRDVRRYGRRSRRSIAGPGRERPRTGTEYSARPPDPDKPPMRSDEHRARPPLPPRHRLSAPPGGSPRRAGREERQADRPDRVVARWGPAGRSTARCRGPAVRQDRDGQRRRRQQRQHVIGAVAGRAVAVAVERSSAGSSRSRAASRSSSEPAPTSTITTPGRRVRARRSTAGRRPRRRRTRRTPRSGSPAAGRSRSGPVSSVRPYGKMLRSASRMPPDAAVRRRRLVAQRLARRRG